MIVYGDPSSKESLAVVVARLEKSLSAVGMASLDGLRAFMIEAGMLEQAVEDALPERAEPYRRLTDAAAEAFVAAWQSNDPAAPHDAIAEALESLPRFDVTLTVKLPEGFAFYTLYPEGYAVAAQRWAAAHDAERATPIVVGVRSIGTTLSAVVAATLRAEGFAARRLTLRPTGHPFAREAILPPLYATHALIIDEGPGLSGSSMAAAAEATCRAGIPPDRIVLFPGHPNEPGPQASESTRALWSVLSRYVVRTEELRWKGRTLEKALAESTAPSERVDSVEELTGGRWRELVFEHEADWPALDAPFERRKLLVRRTDGTALLWKFVGLQEPGTTLGFLATPWIEGRAPSLTEVTPELLARHLVAVAGSAFAEREAHAAHDRLAAMLASNAQEAGVDLPPFPRKGRGKAKICLDDRFAPHEFRRHPEGAIVKIPRLPGLPDHTLVGRQPLDWAVAAATVEWNLDEDASGLLLGHLQAEGLSPEPDSLRFHRAAYAAFRLGMTVQCATQAEPKERERLARAEAQYRAALLG